MRVLILCIHYPVASGRYALAALKRLGHDVRSAGPSTGRDIWGIQIDEKYVWTGSEIEDGWHPELVIVMDSAFWIEEGWTEERAAIMDTGLLIINKTWNCPTVIFGVDNHVRTYEQFNGVADHFFLGHGHGYRIGEPNVSWLPCGYDPAVFTPGPVWSERASNAALLGVMYPQRNALLTHLLSTNHHGIEYKLAVYDQYAALYQNAKISLVASANHDVAQRVWETAAMGCLVLMDECPDGDALGLVDGENCLMYHTLDEAVTKYDWALAHPDEAEQIAQEGQAWASHGTWDARLQVIIEWAEAQKPVSTRRKQNKE